MRLGRLSLHEPNKILKGRCDNKKDGQRDEKLLALEMEEREHEMRNEGISREGGKDQESEPLLEPPEEM